jgi:flagellar hook protein FlgE
MLEMSNVDIASEFINLISAQRAYQANARTITATNTILDDTINLVR